MKTDTINSFHDYLKNQGVGYLTSEACGIGIRALFDYSERGLRVLNGFFGTNLNGHPNMNSYVGNDRAIGSIVLPHSMIRSLVVYCLLMNGADAVIDVQHSGSAYYMNHMTAIYGEFDEEYYDYLRNVSELSQGHYNVWVNSATAYNGRNRHAFSGRVE